MNRKRQHIARHMLSGHATWTLAISVVINCKLYMASCVTSDLCVVGLVIACDLCIPRESVV